jgi:histone-lysine N-methyltransferase SUV420H
LPPPPKAEPEHKEQPLKRRKSKVLLAPPDPIMPESGDPDEDAIDLALGTSAPHVSSHTAQAPATSSVQATKQSGRDVLPDFESLSDLSDPSESEVVKQRGKGHRKKVEYSSSDGGDVPAAPKMLGPQARTETLALFWGAVDGGRRARRPSSNAPERPVVTPRMSRSSGQGHRRSGSGASSRASASRAAIADDEEMDVDDDELRSAMRRPLKKKKKLAPSSSDEEAAAAMPAVSDSRRSSLTHKPTQSAAEAGPQNGHAPARRASLAAPEASVSSGQTSGASSPASAVALATQGSERTSVKNLALFWSAGLNEEGGRTRRQAHRDPKTVTQVPERAKRARASGEAARSSDDSRSATPELKRSKRGAGLKARVSESDVPSISSWHGSREGQMDVSPPSSDTPLRSSSSSQVDKTPSASTSFGWPAGSPAPPPLTAPSPSARVAPGLARPLSASPLAGPFPPASAQPGQPIRRNLRWGSGKVSTSRPLSASPAQGQQPRSSPLVGPAAASQMGVPRPDLKLARLTSTSADAVPQSQSSGAARLPSAVPFATGARRASPGGPSARPSSPLAKLATGLGEFKVPASPASPRCGPASASAKEAAQSGAAPPAAPGAEQLGPALELDAPPTPAALRVPFLAEAPASAAEASQPVKMELDEPALKDTAAAAAPPLATAPLAAPEQRPASETTL